MKVFAWDKWVRSGQLKCSRRGRRAMKDSPAQIMLLEPRVMLDGQPANSINVTVDTNPRDWSSPLMIGYYSVGNTTTGNLFSGSSVPWLVTGSCATAGQVSFMVGGQTTTTFQIGAPGPFQFVFNASTNQGPTLQVTAVLYDAFGNSQASSSGNEGLIDPSWVFQSVADPLQGPAAALVQPLVNQLVNSVLAPLYSADGGPYNPQKGQIDANIATFGSALKASATQIINGDLQMGLNAPSPQVSASAGVDNPYLANLQNILNATQTQPLSVSLGGSLSLGQALNTGAAISMLQQGQVNTLIGMLPGNVFGSASITANYTTPIGPMQTTISASGVAWANNNSLTINGATVSQTIAFQGLYSIYGYSAAFTYNQAAPWNGSSTTLPGSSFFLYAGWDY